MSESAFSAMGSHWCLARTGPTTMRMTKATAATPPAIIEIKPQEMETFASFSLMTFFTRIAPLAEAVKGFLQEGHRTFLPMDSSLTLSRLPQVSQMTETAAMVEPSDVHDIVDEIRSRADL